MMKIFPVNFNDKYEIGEHHIQYSNFKEISQGGPEVGTLIIDGKKIGENDLFGGPPYFLREKLFIPRLNKGLFSRYFKICIIDLQNLSMKQIGEKELLVLIEDVNEKEVVFYTDLENSKKKIVRWN